PWEKSIVARTCSVSLSNANGGNEQEDIPMTRFLLAAVLACLTVHSAMAQSLGDQFTACAEKTGQAYQQARDSFRGAAPGRALLKQKLAGKSWQERLTARVLLGWQQHKERFRQLLGAVKITKADGSAHYAWAGPPEGIKLSDVPLMYELLMKETDPDAAYDA